ncbi:MAG: hypothetical protein GX621_04970 [Pirellulaceae bacterium]|nr:hypothetical protein [Pirellulaceae bacterium]
MKRMPESKQPRGAFSFVELQVALILLGIMMASLVPLVIIQSKQLRALQDHWKYEESDQEQGDGEDDKGYDPERDYWIDPLRTGADGPVYHIVPPTVQDCESATPWLRKLGAPARLRPKVANLTDTDIDDENNSHKDIWLKSDLHVDMDVVNEVSIPQDAPSIELSDQSAKVTVTVEPQPMSIPTQP